MQQFKQNFRYMQQGRKYAYLMCAIAFGHGFGEWLVNWILLLFTTIDNTGTTVVGEWPAPEAFSLLFPPAKFSAFET
jgi:hypothetical protein